MGLNATEKDISIIYPMGPTLQQDSNLGAKARAETLTHFDRLLDWFLKQIDITYHLVSPPLNHAFQASTEKIIEFDAKYGYFSSQHPIIAKVTAKKEDLHYVNHLFKMIHESSYDPIQRNIAVGEVISKVLAYRELEEGDLVTIPSFLIGSKKKLITYKVDKVFDLWHKMPAFGLTTQERSAPSVLVFRGTDLSFDRRSGWASVISDFDLSGPGYSVFQYAKEELCDWLKKVKATGQKASCFGFSLGGIMVMYTAILEPELIDLRCSLAFNPPGVSKELMDKWHDIPTEERPHLTLYVNKGDPVSKWGYLIGKAYELSAEGVKGPIQSHNIFMNGQPRFSASLIDVAEENLSR